MTDTSTGQIDQPTVPALPDILTEAEAARRARLSTRTLQRLAETGRGPPRIRLGLRRVGYWRTDLDAWLRASTLEPKRA